jgi:DNA-binding transcriptional MerR regulator
MNTQTNKLTIQEVASATGLTVHTLRYYEKVGLIHSIGRADNTHRRYTHDDIGWIDFLTKLRATGMSIQQMQAYAELQRQGDETLPERLQMLRDHQQQVETHMAELHQNLEIICYKIGYYQKVVDEMRQPVLELVY